MDKKRMRDLLDFVKEVKDLVPYAKSSNLFDFFFSNHIEVEVEEEVITTYDCCNNEEWEEFNYEGYSIYVKDTVKVIKENINCKFRFYKGFLLMTKETKKHKRICYNCSKSKDIKMDSCFEEFDRMPLSHGLSTPFNRAGNINVALDRLRDIMENPEWEICCSHRTQKIGLIGIILTGENTLVSNTDVWSYKTSMGDRCFNAWDYSGNIVESVEDYSLNCWDHTEHFVKNPTVHSIWIKRSCIGSFVTEEEISEIEKRFPVELVDDRRSEEKKEINFRKEIIDFWREKRVENEDDEYKDEYEDYYNHTHLLKSRNRNKFNEKTVF